MWMSGSNFVKRHSRKAIKQLCSLSLRHFIAQISTQFIINDVKLCQTFLWAEKHDNKIVTDISCIKIRPRCRCSHSPAGSHQGFSQGKWPWPCHQSCEMPRPRRPEGAAAGLWRPWCPKPLCPASVLLTSCGSILIYLAEPSRRWRRPWWPAWHVLYVEEQHLSGKTGPCRMQRFIYRKLEHNIKTK